MIKIFRGGKGWWMGWGVAVKDAWSGVVRGGGSSRDLSKNILKQGVGKGKSWSWGEGVLKVSPPLPPQKILIIHCGVWKRNCLIIIIIMHLDNQKERKLNSMSCRYFSSSSLGRGDFLPLLYKTNWEFVRWMWNVYLPMYETKVAGPKIASRSFSDVIEPHL